MAQRADTTVTECSLTSCVWACFLKGSHTMPGQRHSRPTPTSLEARMACWLERWTHDWKVASSNPGRRIFFSRINYVCWLLFGVRSTPVLPQWHAKDPGHCAKSAGCRLHINTHIPLIQRSRSGLTMILSGHGVGTYPETSSHATCQGTFSHSHLSSLSYCGLILA